MSFKINKIYTDNPYVDEMVYYTKLLGVDTVLKLKDKADANETAESLRNGDLYVSCVEGTAIIEVFPSISTSAFQSAGIHDRATMDLYRQYPSRIPSDKRKKITETLCKEYIANYEEYNAYYRMLHGLPPVEISSNGQVLCQEHYIEDWIPPSNVHIDLYDENGNPRAIHTFDPGEMAILEQYGVIDDLLASDPVKYEYIKHMGNKSIDYYLARRSNKFDILYLPEIESEAIYQMYRDKLDENKFYVLRTIYSEAFKYTSDYYDNMIAIFIVLITMIDIISRVQEFITRKEIFDIRSVQYIFQSNGIPFFGEIPLKYQISMVKNLHTLLKYKSTAKCMVDICSIFGFDNVKIFKYYLLKDRKTDIDGNYVYAYNEDGTENLAEEYDLKFIKLPLDANLDTYIRDKSSYYDYDEITAQDVTWDGGKAHDEIIAAILKEEFNLSRTKYMSIDTISDIAEMAIQQNYFFNMLYDNYEAEDGVTVVVPYISPSESFKVADLFTLLTALTYKYNGYKDIIVEADASKVLYVHGFNFKADLAALWADIENSKIRQAEEDNFEAILVGRTNENGVYQPPTFQVPNTHSLSFEQMMDLYVNNLEVRDQLVEGMRTADNKYIYDIYKKLYDSLMTVELTFDHFKGPDGEYYKDREGDITYSEYLANLDSKSLYNIVNITDGFEDPNAKEQYIATVIDSIVYALEEYIDTVEFQALFSNVPAMSADAARQYMATVINFYKSYKVDFLGMNTVYTIDDKLDGIIKLVDMIDFTRLFDKEERINLNDRFGELITHTDQNEKVALVERMYMDIYRFIESFYNDRVDLKEEIVGMLVDITVKTILSTADTFNNRISKTKFYEALSLSDTVGHLVSSNPKESIGLHDRIWLYKEGIIEGLIDPFMNYVSGDDYNKIIIASEDGDSDTSVNISAVINDTSNDVVTEKAVAEYLDNTALKSAKIVTTIDAENASDEEVPTEDAIIDALTIITTKDLMD